MTFERWSKDLLCKELKAQGDVYYIKKPIRRKGWYCVIPTGFLLRVEAEKINYGFFRLNYEVMPFVGRIVVPPNRMLSRGSVAMGNLTDAARPYMKKFGFDPLNHKCTELRRDEIHLPETYDTAADIIRNFLNPLFDSISTYESYAKAAIEIELYTKEQDEARRKEMVQRLFGQGIAAGVDRTGNCPKDYPQSFPWYARQTTAMPYVYAALNKYEAALAYIRSIRELRMQALDRNRDMVFFQNRMEEYCARAESLKRENCELETALQTSDTDRVKEILQKNYERNRDLVREMLGIELPERCTELS